MKLWNLIFLSVWFTACIHKSDTNSSREVSEVNTIVLPVFFNGDSIIDEKYFAYPRNNIDSVFLNKELFPENIRIARLPQRGDIQPVLIWSRTVAEHPFIQAYTLNKNEQIIDHLTLYSIEENIDISPLLSQAFEITSNYHFKVSKYLKDILIEQLFYKIDENGLFVEIRDGTTPAIAYESMDNIHYTVDSFIWDYNENGGLYRKNSHISYYRINDDGTISQVSNQVGKEMGTKEK